MIRNVVIHISNDQPLVADLAEAPSPGDVTLICTNLRTLDGRKPVFIDDSSSVFVLPMAHVRFIEIPSGSTGEAADRNERARADAAAGPEPDVEIEIDEDFLRRVREA